MALVLPEELTDDDPLEMPPASELVAIRSASVAWMRGLSDRMSESGLAHRIDLAPETQTGGGPVALYVRPEDAERARALDSEFLRNQIPDMDAGGEPSGAEGGCPACGDPFDPGASECPSCGLFLGETP